MSAVLRHRHRGAGGRSCARDAPGSTSCGGRRAGGNGQAPERASGGVQSPARERKGRASMRTAKSLQNKIKWMRTKLLATRAAGNIRQMGC